MLAQKERTATQAGRILDRLWARIRRREPLPTAFDLNQVVDSCLHFHQERISRQSVEVGRDLPTDLPLVVGDLLELEDVLIQLVPNAVDATEPTTAAHRRLSVRTARLDERGLVGVDVADTSAGVDPLVAGGMFEPSVTDTAGTLGIGLTIDKTIVEGFGGQISLNTPMTTGTELRIQLPACGATHR